jgi:hypothetical protein
MLKLEAKSLIRQDLSGTPEWIRTTDLLLRRQTLYPSELRAHMKTKNLLDWSFRFSPKFVQNLQKLRIQCFDRPLDALGDRLRVDVQCGQDVLMPKLGLGILGTALPLHQCSKSTAHRLERQIWDAETCRKRFQMPPQIIVGVLGCALPKAKDVLVVVGWPNNFLPVASSIWSETGR